MHKHKGPRLWTKNFSLITLATALGAMGGIAGGFALSFFVFDETGSTLASALILAIQVIPYVLIPLFVAPIMDRLPRKTFLVCGDIANGVMYAALGLYLCFFQLPYIGYLCLSILLSCLGAIDSLAYNSLYPMLIPENAEQKGYAVASMLYPVLQVIMAPLAAVLLDTLGVAWLLMMQGGMCILAAVTESFIQVKEEKRGLEKGYSINLWAQDVKEGLQYLKKEKGLRSIFSYMSISNGVAQGYSPILVAFFRTAPGFSAALYAFFSVAEFAGRTLGSLLQYRIKIPDRKKFSIVFGIYTIYEMMDMCLLWISYPLMLVNRSICGFLGNNSAILRNAAVQRYIPDHLRSRVNAFNEMMIMAAGCLLSLVIGALGEIMDYRLCMSICGGISMLGCLLFIWLPRKHVRRIYEQPPAASNPHQQ